MSSSETVISVENLSKRYLVGHNAPTERYHSLRDTLVRHGKNFARKTLDMARGRQIIQGDSVEEFWALKDVSFEVKRGEVLGIIGRNGAGKSTLLKILSRITEPTEGRVRIRGRVASLLEVGTGFHPELSGRENIFLNGAILGMTRAEIKTKFDEIVEFAGVEKFLDTPVKRYSSGMYVRLAFAVAAHLEPEILIVDEVLAVGDAEFQKKCLGKMQDVAKGGRTVLFVSHNLAAIKSLCTTSLVLGNGEKLIEGDVASCISYYLSQSFSTASISSRKFSGPLANYFKLIEFTVNGKIVNDTHITLTDSEEVKLEVDFLFTVPVTAILGIALYVDEKRLCTFLDCDQPERSSPNEIQKSIFSLPKNILRKGIFQIGLGAVQSDSEENYLWNEQFCDLEILGNAKNLKSYESGIVNMPCDSYRIRR